MREKGVCKTEGDKKAGKVTHRHDFFDNEDCYRVQTDTKLLHLAFIITLTHSGNITFDISTTMGQE